MQLPSSRERAISGAQERPPALGRERSALHTEMRHSAMLLGGAIGLMGLFAILLLFGTSRLAG